MEEYKSKGNGKNSSLFWSIEKDVLEKWCTLQIGFASHQKLNSLKRFAAVEIGL